MEKLNELPQAFYGVIQDGKVVMLPADDGQWLNKTTVVEAFRALERTADVNMAAAQAMRDDMYHWKQRAEAAEAKLAQREKLDEEAMHCATILEFIGSFESDDIDGDLVDLRFEIDGEDTGSDVSITEYALRSAKAIRAIISGASVSRPAPAADRVPEGWKLVPVEITQEMVDANFEGVCIGGIQAGYRAMLAAAPEVE